MTYHVLIPVNDSDPSREALDYVLSRHGDDSVTVLHVLDPGEMAVYDGVGGSVMADFGEIQQQRREEGEALLEAMRERAGSRGVEISTELITGRPSQTILEYVDENDVDHIVLGSHGRTGASRVLMGSVAETVTRRSPIPVTIIR